MNTTRIPVLLYHSIRSTPYEGLEPYTTTPDDFARHLDALADCGATTLRVSEFVEAIEHGVDLPERVALVTFDDGYADVLEEAAPMIYEREIAATLFMTTGALDRADAASVRLPAGEMLEPANLLQLEQHGFEIGAHSHTHPHLDLLDEASMVREVKAPKAILEDLLGHEVRSFAYPHGYANKAVRRATGLAGYHSGIGVRNAFSSPGDNRLEIARLTVMQSTTLETVSEWLAGRGARLAPSRELIRTKLWRSGRRVAQRGELRRANRAATAAG